jgi:hypothetical protein
MHHSFSGLVGLVAWFLFASPEPVAAAAEPSLSVLTSNSVKLIPSSHDASILRLKHQDVRELTVRLVAVSGEQAQTCATFSGNWKPGPKDKPGNAGEFLLLYQLQRDEQIIPSLGVDAQGAGGKVEGKVVKVKGKPLMTSPAVNRALSPKEEHLLEETFVVEEGKDVKIAFPNKRFKTLEEVKTWTKKNPTVTVIVLIVSWLPAE